MKILFDQGTPVPLHRYLTNHVIDTAYERGWQSLQNGELLNAAEQDGYELLITTDQNLRYQQNFTGRRISIIVLMTTSWPRIQRIVESVVSAVNTIEQGDYREISVP